MSKAPEKARQDDSLGAYNSFVRLVSVVRSGVMKRSRRDSNTASRFKVGQVDGKNSEVV